MGRVEGQMGVSLEPGHKKKASIHISNHQQSKKQREDDRRALFRTPGMAPKREPSIKKSPSPVAQQPRLGPPFPCLPSANPAQPRSAPEQKPRMLRPSDSPFDPSTMEHWQG
ncbi:hypothetical protein J4Q44_G00217130 [Coregonus suidteri]|uniref:Uncharacterized protein n=1 Tax=Coregonus suidteri TaxID=861788 RepID=A0AAN8LH72_9TELE